MNHARDRLVGKRRIHNENMQAVALSLLNVASLPMGSRCTLVESQLSPERTLHIARESKTRRTCIFLATSAITLAPTPTSAVGRFAQVSSFKEQQEAKCATERGDSDIDWYRPAVRTDCERTDVECLDARRRRGKEAAANYIPDPWSSGYTYILLVFALNALNNFVASLKWKDDGE